MIDAVAYVSIQDLLLWLILQCRHWFVGVIYGHHRADGEAEVSANLVCGEGPGQAAAHQRTVLGGQLCHISCIMNMQCSSSYFLLKTNAFARNIEKLNICMFLVISVQL